MAAGQLLTPVHSRGVRKKWDVTNGDTGGWTLIRPEQGEKRGQEGCRTWKKKRRVQIEARHIEAFKWGERCVYVFVYICVVHVKLEYWDVFWDKPRPETMFVWKCVWSESSAKIPAVSEPLQWQMQFLITDTEGEATQKETMGAKGRAGVCT